MTNQKHHWMWLVMFFLLQSDAYQATGCYNLLCSGFVQTNNKIAIGAAISPVSSFSGGQFDITILIWKVTIWFPCLFSNSFITYQGLLVSYNRIYRNNKPCASKSGQKWTNKGEYKNNDHQIVFPFIENESSEDGKWIIPHRSIS